MVPCTFVELVVAERGVAGDDAGVACIRNGGQRPVFPDEGRLLVREEA